MNRNEERVFLAESALTDFQRRVYEATMRIPEGKVTTYRLLGQAIGCRSPRAIGQALKRNPLAPMVPCHRVIASSGRIGGFAGQHSGEQITEKERLLNQEGVYFSADGNLSDPSALFPFDSSH